MIRDLIIKNRSYRRFYEEVDIKLDTLKELIDLARLSASAMNAQPLKYILSCEPERNSLIFPYLTLGAYLKDWSGPGKGERPVAYIIILGDTVISRFSAYDAGIAAQNILLGATEKSLGGCIIASIDREGLRKALDISLRYEILLVLVLGKPREKVVIETVGPNGETKYWRDVIGVHHVPKRPLDDIIIA
jgi:nitroreductase